MADNYERFDMAKKPQRQKLRLLIWLLSFPAVWKHKTKIIRENTKDLKPPYILLCNHNAFQDFKVTTAAIFPYRANYIVAIDGFIGREWLLRMVGCICKRKFTNDVVLIRQMNRVLKNGDIVVIYPEARYSLCGNAAVLPESLGQMCKMYKLPVATLIMHGHHINSPFWNTGDRGVKNCEAVFTRLFSREELAACSVEEINAKIREKFTYDDFAWQKERNILVKHKNRALGLHKVLYQCPHCGAEYKMTSKGAFLICLSCGKRWIMEENGTLRAEEGKTEFSHIPDWYEWERENVRGEVIAGVYGISLPVTVDSLPNSRKFIRLGDGVMTHDMNGFTVRGTTAGGEIFEMQKSVPSLYSCHIEYDYLKKHGDCVDLNTLTDTWYIYPHGSDFSVTKIALATEELYFNYKKNNTSVVKQP